MNAVRVLAGQFTQSMQPVLAVALVVLTLLQVCKWMQQPSEQCRRRPPGPFPWPIIGNATQIGKVPHISFSRMARRYGNVFQIKLGSRSVVVLNGEECIREALVRKAEQFSGRPDFASFNEVSGGRSLAFRSYCDRWKFHRRIAHSTVRAFSTNNPDTKKTFQRHVVGEVQQLIQLFVEKSQSAGYFNPTSNLVVAVANVMSAFCFGKRYSHDDQEFLSLLSKNDQFGKTVGAGSLVDVMPWLQYFPNPVRAVFENFKGLNRDFYTFIRDKALQHRETFRADTVRDIMDAFIQIIDYEKTVSDKGVKLEREYVDSTVTDIFGASQDTLSTALTWIILFLVWRSDVQERLQHEMDRVLGRDRIPTIDDKPHMPYLTAFLFESLRFSSFVPITIPHCTTTDTQLNGYHIAKDTVVFVNQWSVNHDPDKWLQPETFDPGRFLNENGSLNQDLLSSVMIFSLGKRRCIGDELSKMQLFLFTSILMHQCTITGNPTEELTLDFDYGLTLKPKPFSIKVTLRGAV
ncbi:cytochrome P450 1B1 [Callorhinchus milii]|uniref:Cytochrome P450, family 1, subfamily B, polypeptide 1 n=1 Tax=Callorhinchus milii TaxID=7868 RepID=A0A4W3IXI2_CALMI|nr:cytochrome P450 1B1 [Callorhinchus milii]|eukprot:gi/632952907/ref/XP_007892109.1/ PREDICTED: cytochrome P450 1B1 [Callorhinchus milii]